MKLRIVLLFSLLVLFSFAFQTNTTWYVSKSGNNSDGRSWGNAWTEFNRIQWGNIKAGDTILVDGGTIPCSQTGTEDDNCGMVYNTPLNVGVSNITIKLGTQGSVILDGNLTNWNSCSEYLSEPLPPSKPNGSVLETGINFSGRNGVVIDGTKWGGWIVRNTLRYGISFSNGDDNTIRYLKIHHITDPNDTTNNSVGVTQSWQSERNVLELSEIFRIGQDGIRVAGDSYTIRNNYIHDLYCNHPDAIQGFVPTANSDVPDNEGKISNLIIENNVFERIGLQVVFLGENSTHNSWVDGAVIRNNLFLNGKYIIKTKHVNSANFQVLNNTFEGSTEFAIEWCCSNPVIGPMEVRNNIFRNTTNPAGTGFYFNSSPKTIFSDNCLVNSGRRSGNYIETGSTTDCTGRGSNMNLSNLIGTPTPTPTVTNTPTLIPTNTAIPTFTTTPTFTPSSTPIPTFTATPTPTPYQYTGNCRISISLIPLRIVIECD